MIPSLRSLLLAVTLTLALPPTAQAAPSAADAIVVAQIASRTHPLSAENAKGMALGFNAYFATVNAAGGVHGRSVVLQNHEDQFKPAEAMEQIKQVVAAQKAVALFGTIGTAILSEVVKSKILPDSGIGLVGPLNGVPALVSAPNVFPVRASYFDEIEKIVSHLNNIGIKKVSFVHLNTPITAELTKTLEASLRKQNHELTGSVGIDPIPDKAKMRATVEAAVDKMLATEPEALVVFGPGNIGSNLVDYVRTKRGYLMTIYLMSIISADELLTAVGKQRASGVIISQALPLPTDIQLRAVKQYLNDLKKFAPNEKPSFTGLEGYLGARVIHEALKRAGPNPSRAAVVKALDNLGRLDLGDIEVNYTAQGKSGNRAVDITMINRQGVLIH